MMNMRLNAHSTTSYEAIAAHMISEEHGSILANTYTLAHMLRSIPSAKDVVISLSKDAPPSDARRRLALSLSKTRLKWLGPSPQERKDTVGKSRSSISASL
jgi:hypothetical protein